MTPERWQRIEEVFLAAVDLPEEGRTVYVGQACGGDLELRREVESLLASSGPTVDFLERPAVSPRPPGGLEGPEIGLGSRLGPYRLLRRLGEGGMGVVYLALRDDREYEQQVAVKLLSRGAGREEVVHRFRRERQILAGLDHPHVARLLDGGTTGDGQPYFVLEYVEGEPIDRWCDARRLGTRGRIELFVRVCLAVHFLHQNLILHRDLKPGNILIKADGTPKLLDLGIAKLLAPEPGRRAPLTTLGAAPMTVAYASPEQIRGGALTTASDVYALGVLLYELLSGRRPYRDTRSLHEEMEQICREEPPTPSAAVRRSETPRRGLPGEDPAALGRRLTGDLDAVVLRALEKEPARRYASAEQLADDLRRHLEGRPVLARRPTLAYRGWKFLRRHAAAVTAAVLVVLLVAGLGLRMRVLRDRAVAERQRVERLSGSLAKQWSRTVRERDRAREVSGFLVDLFRRANPRVARGEEVTARQLLEEGVEAVRGRLADQPGNRAALLTAMGRSYAGMGRMEEALPLFEESLTLRRQAGGAPAELAEALLDLGHGRLARGAPAEAEGPFREALEILRRQPRPHPWLPVAVNSLAGVLEDRGELEEAEALYREALELRLRRFGPGSEPAANSWNNLAACLAAQGKHPEAGEACRRALELRRQLHGGDSFEVAHTTNNCAVILGEEGDLAAAEALSRESLSTRRRLYDPSHPEVAVALNNLAFLLVRQRRFTEAGPLYAEALAIFRQRHPPGHVAAGAVLRNQAALWLETGRLSEAEAAAEAAVAIFRRALPPGHWRLADGESVLGAAWAAQGRRADAEPLLRRAHAALLEAQGEGSWRTREAAARLGVLAGLHQ